MNNILSFEVQVEKAFTVLPTDLTSFGMFSAARKLAGGWVPPAQFTVVNSSKRPNDFVSWLGGPPLVSERARECIERHNSGDDEFLPFLALNGRAYYVFNCTTELDIIDHQESDIVWLPGTSNGLARKLNIRPLPSSISGFLRIKGLSGRLFVTCEMIVALQADLLTGFDVHIIQEDYYSRSLLGHS